MALRMSTTNVPFISVVIPAHNEARYIRETVQAICNQDYPKDKLEIFVVDNNSTDTTSALAAQSGAIVIPCPSGKVGKVRNLGAAQSRGEILAFIDGDCETSNPRWLQSAAQLLQDPSIGAVGGPALLPKQTSWVERAFVGPQSFTNSEVSRLAGSSFIVRRADFELVGGFSETLSAGEDDELSARIRARGLKIYSSNDCSVIHKDYPKTLQQIFRKQLWHARDQLAAADSWHEPMLILTHTFAVAFVGLILGIALATHYGPWLATGSLIILIAIACALSALKVRRNGGGLSRIASLTIVNLWYLTARSWALLKNYQRYLLKEKKG